jgi:hypothetical protein
MKLPLLDDTIARRILNQIFRQYEYAVKVWSELNCLLRVLFPITGYFHLQTAHAGACAETITGPGT